jgi:hypothetical protein
MTFPCLAVFLLREIRGGFFSTDLAAFLEVPLRERSNVRRG